MFISWLYERLGTYFRELFINTVRLISAFAPLSAQNHETRRTIYEQFKLNTPDLRTIIEQAPVHSSREITNT